MDKRIRRKLQRVKRKRFTRANERTYSAERLKEMVKVASIVAIEGHQRMIDREELSIWEDKDGRLCQWECTSD